MAEACVTPVRTSGDSELEKGERQKRRWVGDEHPTMQRLPDSVKTVSLTPGREEPRREMRREIVCSGLCFTKITLATPLSTS